MSKMTIICCALLAFLAFIACMDLSYSWGTASTVASLYLKSSPVSKVNVNQTSSSSSIEGTKILIAIPAYGDSSVLYVEQLIDSFRDMCEGGMHVTLVLYKTSSYSEEMENLLSSRMHCTRGSFDTKVMIKPKKSGLTFVTFHRQYFFDHAEEYDLFIYAEDDMLIRLRHVVVYLHETARVKQLMVDNFFDYSLGFVRYEEHPVKKIRTVFEFKLSNWTKVDGLEGRYLTSPPPHHQGMFMATREQLLAWRGRCECFRNVSSIAIRDRYYREKVSSMCLFNDPTCNVTPLLPIDTFEDFTIHHLADKYWNNSHWGQYGKSALEMQTIRMRVDEASVKSGNGKITTYDSP